MILSRKEDLPNEIENKGKGISRIETYINK